MAEITILQKRKKHIYQKSRQTEFKLECEKHSLSGSISQRACVFCGSRVVLYPITDALHVIHGPIGCAVYTWDIRGALSSGPELHRNSFSTDLREQDIIYGGEKKLEKALLILIEKYKPKAAFVYATCIVGIIGDDIDFICKKVEKQIHIPVIPVHSEGFKGTKKDGYLAACEAIFNLMDRTDCQEKIPCSINILGEFNLAGEAWMIKEYYEQMGVKVIATITGDGQVKDIQNAKTAGLNVVQCSGSMIKLAQIMEEKYNIPFTRVSYFGIEDMADALYKVADFFEQNQDIRKKTEELVKKEIETIYPQLENFRISLTGKKAAIYVGGAFKAFSLIKALRHLGMTVVLAGSQTGNKDDYIMLKALAEDDTIIVDDANPLELAKYVLEKQADLFIGGVKERPIAYKLGIGFCDHNHERKIPLAGFEGMVNFAREVYTSCLSPVWELIRQKDPFLANE